VSKEWSPDDVFDVLASQTARTILVLASVEPRSVRELAAECNRSKPTVYRRINMLVDYDLLTEQVEIDTTGNHYNTYQTNLERICFEVGEEEFEITIRLRKDLVDRFDELWGALERPQKNSPEQ